MRKGMILSILVAHFDYNLSELSNMTRKELYKLYQDLTNLERIYGNIKGEVI